jgi:CRISPR-associated protein Csx14
MAERQIPIDMLNPGHVLACFGLMETAESLIGDIEARFDRSGTEATFALRAGGDADPMKVVLDFLWGAELTAEVLPGREPDLKRFSSNGVAVSYRAEPHLHSELATDTADRTWTVLRCGSKKLAVNHYADGSSRESFKLWAGASPGARLLSNCLVAMKSCDAGEMLADPMSTKGRAGGVPLAGSMRLDWRRDYVPLDVGFSPNNQKAALSMLGFPLVELLASIGLTHARPERKHRLLYRYGVADGIWLRPSLHRPVLGAKVPPWPGLPILRFEMQLGWPGRAGQARCITATVELPSL